MTAKQRIRARGTSEYRGRTKHSPSEIKAAIKAKRLQNIKFLNDAKRRGCQICGYGKCLAALEFHHSSGDKKFIISRAKGFSLARIKEELKKCMVVCANCHRELHSKDEGSLFLLKVV